VLGTGCSGGRRVRGLSSRICSSAEARTNRSETEYPTEKLEGRLPALALRHEPPTAGTGLKLSLKPAPERTKATIYPFRGGNSCA
jgi:hypothetical protein